jgi:hypothetical protein
LNRPISRLWKPSGLKLLIYAAGKSRLAPYQYSLLVWTSSALTIPSAHRIASGDSDLGIAIVATVDVHPQHVLPGLVIVDDLGPLDDAVRSLIAATRPRQQRALVLPPDEVIRRVAIDVDERRALALILADEVVCPVYADDTGPVGIEVFAIRLDRVSERALLKNGCLVLIALTYSSPRPAGNDL